MTVPARVVLIGASQAGLDLRAAVLEHFWAVRTTTFAEGESPRLDGDVVVICSSLGEAAQQSLVDRVRLAAPLILIVREDGFDSGPLAGADATVDEVHGPGAMVSTIYELLTERGLVSRGWAIDGLDGWLQ